MNTHTDTRRDSVESTALFGIPVFSPLEHGIHGEPLMVPAHEWNKLASAVQSVIDQPDYTNPEGIIRRLKDSLPNARGDSLPPQEDTNGH